MDTKIGGRLAVLLFAVLAVAWPAASSAGVIPSKAEDPAPASTRQGDLDRVNALLARQDVARALADRGLTADQVEQRVAQLSDEDVRALAGHADRIQAAGAVPEYIWILLGILLAVTILTTVF
jgi:hypothetical protein